MAFNVESLTAEDDRRVDALQARLAMEKGDRFWNHWLGRDARRWLKTWVVDRERDLALLEFERQGRFGPMATRSIFLVGDVPVFLSIHDVNGFWRDHGTIPSCYTGPNAEVPRYYQIPRDKLHGQVYAVNLVDLDFGYTGMYEIKMPQAMQGRKNQLSVWVREALEAKARQFVKNPTEAVVVYFD